MDEQSTHTRTWRASGQRNCGRRTADGGRQTAGQAGGASVGDGRTSRATALLDESSFSLFSFLHSLLFPVISIAPLYLLQLVVSGSDGRVVGRMLASSDAGGHHLGKEKMRHVFLDWFMFAI